MEMSDHDETPPASPAAFCTDGNNNHHVTPDGNHINDGGSSSSGNSDITGVDYIDQPVKDPHAHDVLCGRGGNINSHPGNERFRLLVDKRKRVYLTARFKREKRLIASSIVSEIRALKPAGRFLSQDKKTGVWKDIGEEKARDKTSQALRENAPTIRAKIETEINEQREEMKKEESDHHHHHPSVAPSHHHAQHGAAPPPHAAPPFYAGWGPYSYYGYAQHPPPPPPPPPPQPQIRYYPPPPTPAEQPPIWGSFYPPAGASSATSKAQPKSAIEQTADYITSGAESIKSWTRASLSFGGDVSLAGTTSVHTADHNDHNGDGGSIASVASKPLSYVHQDDSKKRRIVKFRSDTKRITSRRRMGSVTGQPLPPSYPPDSNSTHSLLADNSITGGEEVDDSQQGHGEMMEPHNLDEEQNNSLMTQVANQILGSIGSWDAGSILCGTDNSDRHDAPFPRHHHHSHRSSSASASASAMAGSGGGALADELEDDMAVEWEGQEVQLLDPRSAAVPDCATSVASEDRMPPPSRGHHHSAYVEQTSVGAFSSLGSCHSWMPEQFGSVSSFFGGGATAGSRAGAENMEMDHYSAVHSTGGGTTENYSAAGSLGGNSLMRVFENESSVPDGHSSSSVQQYNNSRNSISQVPSWDRSFRSRSPLSVESSDDDASLMSKDDTTVSGKGPETGGTNIPVSPMTHSTRAPTPPPPESDVDIGGMAWETRE
jgi:hypothetical protein